MGINGIPEIGTARWNMYSRLQWRLLFFFIMYVRHFATGQIRYTIAEELKRGSFVGNIAQDLGLEVTRMRAGRARIVTGEGMQYVELKTDKGILVVNERIDRERVCSDISPCILSFEIFIENPVELHRVSVEVFDINDHVPTFQKKEIKLEISESTALGTRFLLGSAEDPDEGVNALKNYILYPTENFILKQHSRPDGVKYAEMVLQKPLDREEHPHLSLTLTAVDGGNPQRSGTVIIDVTVLDVNDNAPVFNQTVYRATVMENAPKGTHITTVNATDSDSGSNGLILYSFANLKGNIAEMFYLDVNTGAISVAGEIDFEKMKKREISIEAKDQGGLGDSSKVIVEVIDVNDNAPVISIMSFSSSVSEAASIGTTVAVINVKDIDSQLNGLVTCSINLNTPFKVTSSLGNYYGLLTDSTLDRETVSQYNIILTARDSGIPSLSSTIILNVTVTDINDNAPKFDQTAYTISVMENNSPGLSIFTVRATDSDWNQNAQVSYIIEETHIRGAPMSAYISINSDTGVIYAVRSFDYEEIRSIRIQVKAQDGGSPSLHSNSTINILIQDQNDNTPQVLYPVQTGGSLVAEMVPRSADVGYLVTKVVAVDVDSGQNAWLSYKLLKTTERGLFDVGLQNGEIRTVRQVSDKDPVKHKLTVIVEDNGQPSRSATVNVNVVVADSFPEVLSEFSDFTHDVDYSNHLTFYLVLALAAVSFLFISSLIIVISVKIYRWRKSRIYYQANLPVIPYYAPQYADAGGTGTLQHMYNYEVCMTTDSRKSDCKFARSCSQNIVVVDPGNSEKVERAKKEKSVMGESESPEKVRKLSVF